MAAGGGDGDGVVVVGGGGGGGGAKDGKREEEEDAGGRRSSHVGRKLSRVFMSYSMHRIICGGCKALALRGWRCVKFLVGA